MQTVPTITYDGQSVVTATIRVSPNSPDFAEAVSACRAALRQFPRSKLGSDWGCDGVGYECQRRIGAAVCHKSGVGPRKYAAALAAYRAIAYAIPQTGGAA